MIDINKNIIITPISNNTRLPLYKASRSPPHSLKQTKESKTMTLSRVTLAALGCTALTFAANAVDVKMYGTVNKALMGYSDGTTTDMTVVDNNNESTRIGFGGEQMLDNGLTASVLLEMEHASNKSNTQSQNTAAGQSSTPTNTSASLTERIARVGLAGEYGAVFIGQQDVASDDAYSHDLAAANSVLNANVASFGGGLTFRNSAGAVVAVGGTNLTPNVFALGNDGSLAATDSIRFNTATINGFNASLSASQGGNMDAAIRYAGAFGDFAIDTALAHSFVNDQATTATNEQTGITTASISAKHNSGLAGTFAYVTNHLDNKAAGVEEAEGMYGKVGYAWDAYGVAAEYGKFKNPVAAATDHEMDVYGVGAEYNLGNGVTAGALYRNFSADVTGVSNIEDIDVYTVSMRVKF